MATTIKIVGAEIDKLRIAAVQTDGTLRQEFDVCLAGNPALNGWCGDRDCVCYEVRKSRLLEYRRQQEELRKVAIAAYKQRCEREQRERVAGLIWLLPVLVAVLGVGWIALWVFQQAIELFLS